MNALMRSAETEPARRRSLVQERHRDSAPRVLILTADAGSGHRSAALAIEAAIQMRYGATYQVKVVNPLHLPRSPGVLRFAERAYQTQITRAPELYQFQYEVTDSRFMGYMMNLGMTALLQRSIEDLLAVWPADVIVSTYRPPDALSFQQARDLLLSHQFRLW